MHVLLSIALAMAGGLVLSRVVKLLKLPNVTGYLIAGLIVGPCCLNLVNQTNLGYIKIISTVALGFIAFSIGGEFKLEHLKKLGKSIVTITFCQALFAVAFVMLGLFALKFAFPDQIDTPMILLLGAIATATAPAATACGIKRCPSAAVPVTAKKQLPAETSRESQVSERTTCPAALQTTGTGVEPIRLSIRFI